MQQCDLQCWTNTRLMCRLRAGQQWVQWSLQVYMCAYRRVHRQCQLVVCAQKQGLISLSISRKVKRETLEGRRIFFTKNRPPSLLICALIDLPFSKSIKVCKIDFLLDFWSGLMKKQYVKSENRKEGVNLCAILYAPFDLYAPFLIFWFTYCFFSLTSFKIYRKLIKNTRHRTQNAMRVRHDSGRRIFA